MPLASVFERAQARGTPALVPYLMAGDPDAATTSAILARLRAAGADAVELGIPYSDPLADGPTIQAAGQRALEAGMALDGVFALAAGNGAAGGVPAILFTYYNPVLQYGPERFAERCVECGVEGVIIPDVPFEEIELAGKAFADRGIDVPLLVTPTTPPQRAMEIARRSRGFIYIVSRLGVTGAGAAPDVSGLTLQIERLRKATALPLVVGFGVSSAAHVDAISPYVDGIIVGSALIDAYQGAAGAQAAERVERFLQSLVAGTSPISP